MKWSLRNRIQLVLPTILLFLFTFGIFVYFSVKKLGTDTGWLETPQRIIRPLQRIYVNLKDAQTNYADFLLTGKQSFAKTCESDMRTVEEEMRKETDMVAEDYLWHNNIENLRALLEDRLASLREGLAYARAGRKDLAIAEIRDESEKRNDKAIKDLITQMTGMQAWILKAHKEFQDRDVRQTVRNMIGGSLFILAVCVAALYFILRQFNERQAVLTELKSSEEKFRHLAENANEAFVTADQNGVIVDINPSAETMFGYPRSELIGKELSLLMPKQFLKEEGGQAFNRFLQMTNPKEGVSTLELYAHKKDGTEFPVEVSVSSWNTREGIFYTTINRDITERKFFMRTLLKNEHRLFQFLEAVPVGIIVWDKTGMPYYANQTAKDLLGRDILKDVATLGKNFQVFPIMVAGTDRLYPAESLPITRAMIGMRSFVDDMEIHQPGKTIPVHSWGAPILDENGEVKFGLAALLDMTRQKEITESLQSREEFFRNLFEEGPIGMTLAFPDFTLVNVNRAFCNMLGYSKDKFIGKSFLEFTHPEDIPSEQLLTQKLFDKLIPKYQLEKRYITSKGQPIWCKVSASTIRDLNDEPMFRLAIVENITEQKEAETALKESEERFRTLTQSANDAIISVDSKGAIIFYNPAAEKIFGHPMNEVLGEPFHILMAEGSWQANQQLIQNYLATGKATLPGRTLELAAKRKNGEEFPVELSYFSWKTTEGLFFTSIMRDITERKQIEEMKNDLISVVSHQLKTPVAEINGYIENMLEGLTGELSDRQQQYLLDMKEIGLENYRLISDLLSLSKLERGVITIDPAPVPVQEMVQLALRDYESFIHRKGLRLIIENIPDNLWVMADRDKTVETLRNLINNAIKCTDRGSITLQAKTDGPYAFIEVTDTGIGMSEETMKRLFTKARVLGSEAGRSGAGLGLYIAKHFMNLQNGDISVKSALEQGSTFSVKLPLSKEP